MRSAEIASHFASQLDVTRASTALWRVARHATAQAHRYRPHVVGGKVHSLGRWGSQEAQDRFGALVAAFIASGRKGVDAGVP